MFLRIYAFSDDFDCTYILYSWRIYFNKISFPWFSFLLIYVFHLESSQLVCAESTMSKVLSSALYRTERSFRLKKSGKCVSLKAFSLFKLLLWISRYLVNIQFWDVYYLLRSYDIPLIIGLFSAIQNLNLMSARNKLRRSR